MAGAWWKKGLFASLMLCSCAPPAQDPAQELACQSDSDCDSLLPHCNQAGICVECLAASDCPSCHQYCDDNGQCLMFEDRGQTWQNSSQRSLCLPENECTAGVNCCSLGFFCNIYSGQCLSVADYTRACTTENVCPDGLVCDTYHQVCVPQPTCQGNYNCCTVDESITGAAISCSAVGKCNDYEVVCTPPETESSTCPYLPKKSDECEQGKFCVAPGICVQCTCDADCPEGSNLVCNLATGLCKSAYSCQNSSECTSSSQLCDTSIGRCVARCDFDIECGYEEYCNTSLHVCRPESQRPCQADEYEPNEDKSAAYRLTDRPELLSGIKCPGDQDWYILPLKRADQVTLKIYETNQSSGTVYLDLLATDGSTVLATTNNGFFAQAITFTANDDSDYYLWVYTTAPDSYLQYSIAISYATGEICLDSLEERFGKNDTLATATVDVEAFGTCRLEESVATRRELLCESGELQICSGDADYYQLQVPDGQIMTVAVYGHSTPLKIALLDQQTALLSELPASSGRQEITVAGRPGGAYYLLVQAQDFGQSSYKLAVTLWDGNKELGCSEDSFDALAYNDDGRNFSNATAWRLQFGQNSVSGSLCLGDLDVYRLLINDGQSDSDIPAGNKLSGVITGLSADTEVAFYRQNGNDFQLLANDDAASWHLDVTNGQPLYALVRNNSFERLGNYTMQMELLGPPECQPDEFEDNATPATATALTAGTYQQLSLCAADTDWYQLTVLSGETITIDLQYDSQLPAPVIRLYNQRLLASADLTAEDSYEGLVLTAQELTAGKQRLHVVAAAGGSYYLQVKNQQGWPLTDYTLQVEYAAESCQADAYALLPNDTVQNSLLLPLTADNNFTFFDPQLTICQSGEEDWYAVKASGGDELDIKVHYQPGEGNLDLYLYPPSALLASTAVQQVAYDWDDTAPYQGLLHVAYTIPDGQAEEKWPFVVRPYQAMGSSSFNNLYALEVSLKRDCVADGVGAQAAPALLDGQSDAGYLNYEAGTFATYSPEKLPLDGSEISGSLSLCGNEDWLLIKLDEENGGADHGLTVCAAFDHDVGDIDLQLYSADDMEQPLLESATKKNFEGIILTSPAKLGYYYLRVFLDPRDKGHKVNYKLRVFGGDDYSAAGCVNY